MPSASVVCAKCGVRKGKAISYPFLLDDENLARNYKCFNCGYEWDRAQSLLHNGDCYHFIFYNNGNILIHRWVWQQKYNCILQIFDIIHHINGNRGDNRVSNLARMDKHNHCPQFNKTHPHHNLIHWDTPKENKDGNK